MLERRHLRRYFRVYERSIEVSFLSRRELFARLMGKTEHRISINNSRPGINRGECLAERVNGNLDVRGSSPTVKLS